MSTINLDDTDNTFPGTADADEVFGNLGNDTLYGGSGADSFSFHSAFGHDVIADYKGSIPAECRMTP